MEVKAACFPAEIKVINHGQEELSKETLCGVTEEKGLLFYVSKGCEDNQCEILKRPFKTLVIKDYRGNIGSPGFKLCRALEGMPQIFEWKNTDSSEKNKWSAAERCFFGKEFVEIPLLTKKWKPFIKKK